MCLKDGSNWFPLPQQLREACGMEQRARAEVGETGTRRSMCLNNSIAPGGAGDWVGEGGLGALFLMRLQKACISTGLQDINPAQYVLAANKMNGHPQKTE